MLFLFLVYADGSKYYLRYSDPQPNGIYVGEPMSYSGWPTGNLHFAPAAHVFVDMQQQTVRLEDIKPNETYRIKTLVTTHSDHEYMYMSKKGTKCNPIISTLIILRLK